MITLTTPSDAKVYLARQAVAQVTEASPSSQWHGIRSIVRTFDGRTVEARERAEDIVTQINAGDPQ